ncbi:hypothetical protein E4P41_09990 [Geodermatophilus sp. DF01-2]|uniref:hypothetical protein n=1 Tax=Geodermatophilus sp. DF01-2 TaxID=2559610 RepID=UPI00107360AD|nr:hypothetical protein [Geodermatophilus sp. DF01_2]TFV61238.1 hypothetical protein E4P41_09990 [Geodermatophilus sp. DF01_2]
MRSAATDLWRAGVVLAVAVALVMGAALSASASFVSQRTVALEVSSATVQAPGNVTTAGSWCWWSTFGVQLSWTPSSSPGVSGYTVRVHREGGTSSIVATVGREATSFSGVYWGGRQEHRFTVTTETTYGWTAVSPQTSPVRC